MNLKQYTTLKIVIVVALAMLCSWSVTSRNYIFPIIGVTASYLILFYFRGRVKEIIADERDYEIGGASARWAMQIYSWFAVAVMFFLYAKREINPAYETIAATLAYSTCFLMLVYALIFRFYNNVKVMDKTSIKGKVLTALGIVIIIMIIMAGLRLLSGEDDWMCQEGVWVQHGHPDFPAPSVECKK